MTLPFGQKMKVWSSASPSLVSWCPVREQSRLFASAQNIQGQTPQLDLCQFNFLGATPQTELVHSFKASSPYTVLDWTIHSAKANGIIAAGHQDGTVDIVIPNEKKAIPLGDGVQAKGPISGLAFNPTQNSVLLTVSERDINVWDLKSAEQGKPFTTGSLSRAITGNITGIAWHNSPTLPYIFGFCDANGQVVVWDLRSTRSTHTFADNSFRAALSDIKFSPLDKMLVATSSGDSRNAVVYLWDLRNTTQPTRKLHGHTAGINCLEWPKADKRLLFSAGNDGNIIAWNVETGEQVNTISEGVSAVTDLAWSPFIHGAVLASTTSSTNLYSFADPSAGAKTKFTNPAFHQKTCGIDVAFDGKIFQYHDSKVKSFEYKENIAESGDFMNFVEALESKTLGAFANEKAQSEDETERKLWEVALLAMDRKSFKENLMKSFNLTTEETAEQLLPASKPSTEAVEMAASSADLFGDAPIDESAFGADVQEEADVFGEVFTPFRVLPKKKVDEAGNIIATALISGKIQVAVDCAFNAEKYAEALIVASCGGPEIFNAAKNRYIKLMNSPLTKLVSHISDKKLDTFVKCAKVKDWKEIMAVICNYATDDYEQLSAELGRRLINEKTDFEAALYCFVAAKQYDMVQQCLFNIYEKANKDTSSAEVILLVMEKLCAIAGENAGAVVGDVARSFLQHVIQSGHKADAVRFVDALPNNKQLLELRNALAGAPIQQAQPQQRAKPAMAVPQAAQPPAVTPQGPGIFHPTPAPEKPATPVGPQIYRPAAVPPTGLPSNQPAMPPPPAAKPAVPPPSRPAYPSQPSVFMPAPSPYAPPVNTPPVVQPPPPSAPAVVKPPPPAPTVMTPPVVMTPQMTPPPMAAPPTIAPPPMAAPQINAPPRMAAPQIAAPPSMPPTIAPPPMAAPQINAPPPMAAPQITTPPSMPPTMAPPMMSAPPMPAMAAPPTIAPPPMAAPQINAPPPVAKPSIIAPPMAVQGMPPQAGFAPPPAAQVQAAPAPTPKNPEATIDEVPESTQGIAQALDSLIKAMESREMSPQAGKALQDAKQKLPYVFAAFRDEKASPEVLEALTLFVQKVNASDMAGATQIKKKATMQLSKCRDVFLLLNYIQNAMK